MPTPAAIQPAKLSRATVRKRSIRRIRLARGLVQIGVAAFILTAAVRHNVAASKTPSVDALCPFGAVETLITWLMTGNYISKIHTSNMILGGALLISVLLVGNAFCGWICPFGTVQDGLTWISKKLHLPQLTIPRPADRVLRWGRFVVLAVILWMSYTISKLWFAEYDPYVNLFGLHFLFEAMTPALAVGLGITAAVLIASLFIERAWCRYLCPLGGVLSVISRVGLLRIRREPAICTDCTLCSKACPVGIEPGKATPFASADCIGCMDCLPTCPVPGALRLDGPVLLGVPTTKPAEKPVRNPVAVGSTR